MSDYNANNYTEQGGEITHIRGIVRFEPGSELRGAGIMPNQFEDTSSDVMSLRTSFNNLLQKLKGFGLMEGDPWGRINVTKDLNDQSPANAARQSNTEDIASVERSGSYIIITLSKKVSELKDFDGGNGWGVHKWLGIGISTVLSGITDLYYNGKRLTNADVAEAVSVGLTSPGYFVRWVAADLVLAGDNSQSSTDTFTLWARGYKETTVKLRIVEPE